MSQLFDFDKALKALQSGQSLTGKDGILKPLIKQLTEAAAVVPPVFSTTVNEDLRPVFPSHR